MSVRWPSRGRGEVPSVAEFCETHDLVQELVPFASRTVDPWEMVRDFDAELRSLPATAATFQVRDLLDDPVDANHYWAGSIRATVQLLGAWPLNERGQRPIRWVNPHYPHERALGPGGWDSREGHLRKCANVAVHDVSDIAPRFDLTRGALSGWISRNDIPWHDWRMDARATLARTIRTAAEWKGCTRKELIELLPVGYSRVKKWTLRYATENNWTEPSDPSLAGGVDGD